MCRDRTCHLSDMAVDKKREAYRYKKLRRSQSITHHDFSQSEILFEAPQLIFFAHEGRKFFGKPFENSFAAEIFDQWKKKFSLKNFISHQVVEMLLTAPLWLPSNYKEIFIHFNVRWLCMVRRVSCSRRMAAIQIVPLSLCLVEWSVYWMICMWMEKIERKRVLVQYLINCMKAFGFFPRVCVCFAHVCCVTVGSLSIFYSLSYVNCE